MKTPATQLSLKLLRRNGWTCQVVEHWNQHVKRRQDCYGFADILAFNTHLQRIALVQTTSASNFASRYAKVTANEDAAGWLQSGGEIFLHGWYKPAHRWQCREEVLVIDEMAFDTVPTTR